MAPLGIAILSALIGAIVGGVTGAMVSASLAVKASERKGEKLVERDLYMSLMHLGAFVDGIAQAETRGEEPGLNSRRGFKDIGWTIRDKLREWDACPELEDILRVVGMVGLSGKDRQDLLSRTLDALGSRIDPRYRAACQKLFAEDVALMEADPEAWGDRMASLLPPFVSKADD